MVAAFIDFLQLLSFPTQVMLAVSSSMSGVQTFLDYAGGVLSLNEESLARIGESFWIVAYSASLAWTLVFVGLVFLVGCKFMYVKVHVRMQNKPC